MLTTASRTEMRRDAESRGLWIGDCGLRTEDSDCGQGTASGKKLKIKVNKVAFHASYYWLARKMKPNQGIRVN
jgi:hypothetical protein